MIEGSFSGQKSIVITLGVRLGAQNFCEAILAAAIGEFLGPWVPLITLVGGQKGRDRDRIRARAPVDQHRLGQLREKFFLMGIDPTTIEGMRGESTPST